LRCSRTLVVFSVFLFLFGRPLSSTLFPYTTLFRSWSLADGRLRFCGGRPRKVRSRGGLAHPGPLSHQHLVRAANGPAFDRARGRSEEHTSELQSRVDLVCRLLLEKKKKNQQTDEMR